MRNAKSALATVAVLGLAAAHGDPSKPVPVSGDPSWFKAHRSGMAKAAKAKDAMLFVGDSLTEYWTSTGKANWFLDFHSHTPVNLGIAADRVEHIHYRVRQLKLAKDRAPKAFVVLAGTNNLAKSPPDAPKRVAEGVAALARTLRAKSPSSVVAVISILPNSHDPSSKLREDILAANAELRRLAGESAFDFIDVHDAFLDSHGRWKRGLTIDGTHLSRHGYDIFARLLRPEIDRLLGEKSAGDGD